MIQTLGRGGWLVLLGALGSVACGPVESSEAGAGADSGAGNSSSSGGSSSGGSPTGTGGNSAGGSGSSGGGKATSSGGNDPGNGGSGSGGQSSGGAPSGGTANTGGASTGGTPGTTQTRLVGSAVFYQDITGANVDSESGMIMAALQASGWGDAGRRQTLGVDFSFEINVADPGLSCRSFTQPSGALPDCDTAAIPLPPGGKTEGSPSGDYACSGGDCHLIVFQGTRLYELYQADVTGGTATGGTFTGGCLVVWDLTRDYWVPTAPPNFSRGDGCNGADAGDMPMAPLLVTEAELAAGEITHALRFTISNNRIRSGVYVHPATHIGGPTGGADTLPYGARLRLKSTFDVASLPNVGAQTIARALQKYGMFLADGGNIYISATTGASNEVGGSDMGALQPSDFEMIDGGERIDWRSQNCTRTPVP